MRDCGIQDLTIEFRRQPFAGHFKVWPLCHAAALQLLRRVACQHPQTRTSLAASHHQAVAVATASRANPSLLCSSCRLSPLLPSPPLPPFTHAAHPPVCCLQEAGYNALHMGWVQHSWIKNLQILNADSAIATYQCTFCTLSYINIANTGPRGDAKGSEGHRGIWMDHGAVSGAPISQAAAWAYSPPSNREAAVELLCRMRGACVPQGSRPRAAHGAMQCR